MSRATQLGPAEIRLLDDWGKALHDAFPACIGVVLVGSAIDNPKYRDIDVRIIMPDDTFASLAAGIRPRRLNLMLTLWGQRVTGLPIDCQLQPMTHANAQEGWCRWRWVPRSEGIEGA